jgi:hypothetical protein
MACDLTAGRLWECKEQVGGIKTVYFADFGDLTGLTVGTGADAGKITTGLTGKTLYRYELPDYTGNLTETLTASAESGTLFYEQALEITLHKLRAADSDEIKLLAKGRPHCIVVDNNDNQLLLGFQKGLNVTTVAGQTGTAAGDLSGYVLSFTASEVQAAPFVTDAISNATIVSS